MTGYAITSLQQDGFTVTVSLRSVNHRFLDLHLQLPEFLLPLEGKVRQEIQERNPRGHLVLKVTFEQPASPNLCVNEELVSRYVEVFRRLGTQYGLAAELDAATLSQLPGVIAPTSPASATAVSPGLEAALSKALQETLDRWDEMRAAEAKLLAEDLGKRILRVRDAVEQMEQLGIQIVPQTHKKLHERLQTLLGQAALDASRLAQEAALLADRTDTTEEILRLKAHVTQFSNLLAEGTDAGRKFDFLLQEMHRELTTLLSKTAGLGESSLPITRAGLDVKAEVEKLREQVQNLQ